MCFSLRLLRLVDLTLRKLGKFDQGSMNFVLVSEAENYLS